MPLLKAFFLIKQTEGGKLNCYYQKRGNYDSQSAILNCNGFRDWHHAWDGRLGEMQGFCCVQMRPKCKLIQRADGRAYFVGADFGLPFTRWKFNIKHTPAIFTIPDWVHVGAIKAECLLRLPEWAATHLIKRRSWLCKDGEAIAALSGTRIRQIGGKVWGFKDSVICQEPGHYGVAHLHERSMGFIHSWARAIDSSHAEVFPGGHAEAFENAEIVLRPGPRGEYGTFAAYSPSVRVFRQRYAPGRANPKDRPAEKSSLIPVEFIPVGDIPRPEPASNNLPFGQAVE